MVWLVVVEVVVDVLVVVVVDVLVVVVIVVGHSSHDQSVTLPQVRSIGKSVASPLTESTTLVPLRSSHCPAVLLYFIT